MSNIDYYRATLLGAIIGMSFVTLCYMVFGVALDVKESPQKGVKPSQFEVVDKYKGCDVVRWTQDNFAEYKYFLHCNK